MFENGMGWSFAHGRRGEKSLVSQLVCPLPLNFNRTPVRPKNPHLPMEETCDIIGSAVSLHFNFRQSISRLMG